MDATIDAVVETRRLGELERIFHILHRWRSLVAVEVLHIRGPLDAARVRRAVDLVQQSVPMLRAHVRISGVTLRAGVPFFAIERDFVTAGTGPIPLREAAGDWRSAMRGELATPLANGKNPRLRVVLVAADAEGVSRLIITTDHGVCDAQAFLLVARLLLGFLADPDRTPIPDQGLPPPLEALHQTRSRGTRREEPPIRLPARRTGGNRDETAIEERRLTGPQTAAIRVAARHHRTTVHGTFGAALLAGVRDVYGVNAMTLLSSFEFRRLCQPPVPPEAFGCYVDAMRTTHGLDGGFWDLAREIAFKLVATVASDRAAASILKLPDLSVALREGPRLLGSGGRVDGVGLTTGGDTRLGRKHGPFALEDLTIGLSMHAFGPGMFLASVEHEGAHKLMISYAPHAVPTADVVAIADRTVALLRNLPA